MSAARVSIVITCFNYERFVGEAIASALSQEHPNTEVIAVDDGSQDGSRAAIAAFGERVVQLEKPNGGQASAINAGFRASHGAAVIFLDADDVLLPAAAGAVADALLDQDVAKAHWSMPVIDAMGTPTGATQDPELAEGDLRADVLADGPLSDATMPNPPMSGNAFARAFLERVMPIPEEPYRTAADEYLFALAPAFGRIVRLPPQSLYRLHGQNDHAGWSFERMLSFQERHHALVAQVASDALSRAGHEHDRESWSAAAWWLRAGRVTRAIEASVPVGERFLLIDGGALGIEADLRGRLAIPFPQVGGAFAGSPADDDKALELFKRADADGLHYAVVAFPAFWWLEEFPSLAASLRRRTVLAETPDVLIYPPRGT